MSSFVGKVRIFDSHTGDIFFEGTLIDLIEKSLPGSDYVNYNFFDYKFLF